MKKIICIYLISQVLFPFSNIFKENISKELDDMFFDNYKIYKSIYLGDDENNFYYEYNSNSVKPLASLTKIMTAILIIDDIREGKYNLDTKVKVTQESSKVMYGYVVKEGKRYTVEDLLKLLLINSSNSSAYLLAEFSSNYDINKFIDRMNNKAKELGLTSLKYYTPHGLPPVDTNTKMDRGNAKDIYKLALYAINYPEIIKITNNDVVKLSDGTTIKTTNPLIYKEEIKGLKTGYHRRAGYNIIYYMEFENGEKLIEVILGSYNSEFRKKVGLKTIELMENGGK